MSVRYGNPPKDSQFKKGTSGNPKGRRRREQVPVNIGVLLRKVAGEKVSIEFDGRKITISYLQAYVHQIYSMALSKNTSAARLLDQLRRQFPNDLPPGDPIYFHMSEDDAKP